MGTPAILGLATVVPPNRHSQWEIYERLVVPRIGSIRLVQAAFMGAEIDYRHSVLADEHFYAQAQSTEARNQVYMQHARPLGAEAIRRCLADAGLTAEDVDDLIIVSCTGLDTPGLDLLLAAELGMRDNLRRTSILAMGCYAGLTGLIRAADAVRARPGTRALVLCVELCTLHFREDLDLDNLISIALFADGVAAALVGDALGGPRLLGHYTFSDYQTLDHMAWHLTDRGFRMKLSAQVPDVLRAQTGPVLEQLLGPAGLRRGDIRFWGIHPGGSRILDYLQAELGLDADALRFSRQVLREYGNMSSATVLFVLEEIRRQGSPQPGDYGVLMAFGPGLTLETWLVQW
jgi:predicted naringenin-chalcone synthase